ncbi:NERD domain-containing protein [Neobacillus bataviensis LMG 21833]|uniref:NERD domain-containing protein n=1 Tax=Neobacillus bataviensis LMG 21833 TaxID=1117379 RepID=K6DEV1_9BACI|nr:nuclease-related domain-containing protein [Neobacillus bataviensis]EKN71052.1 NERD domain-containing protein [Neobacillus bataviensis LMG 21833]
MAYKPRTKSKELIILELLNTLMTLPEKDKQHYFSLKKGYEGELMFDALTENLQCECLILNDLLFKVNNTTFQIDSLIIISEKLYLYEVKNFEGDYFYVIDPEADRLYKRPKKEYTNPLHQLNRCESLLRQLLHNIGFTLPIEAQVVFINPGFTLYQAPLDKPFIFPTQVNSYLKKFDMRSSRLTGKHKMLADKLISLHIEENPYTTLPQYNYEGLRKGITCELCRSFSISVQGKKCVCGDCGHDELVTSAVLRSVNELKLLFPEMRITSNLIYDWCRVVDSKRTIRKILEKNYKKVGVHQWTYYE